MKALFAILLLSAMLLFGCAGSPAQQAASPAAQGSPSQAQPQAAPSGGNSAPSVSPSASGTPAASAPQVKEITVEASNWQFSPDTITVNKGDTVKITLVNKDVSHGIAIPAFGFDLKAGAGETATGQFTADQAGTFPFHCSVFCGDGHREMTGTLIVQ